MPMVWPIEYTSSTPGMFLATNDWATSKDSSFVDDATWNERRKEERAKGNKVTR